MLKLAANHTSWAIGRQQRNGFHVRKVVWGLLMAMSERRSDEEIRAASILVENTWKRRHAKPRPRPAVEVMQPVNDDGEAPASR